VTKLRLLGAPAVIGADPNLTSVTARRRPLALLALVAAEGEGGVTRERACALLWPELDQDHAANNLKQVIFTLRRSLGHDLIERASATIRLNPAALSCDLWEFQQALLDQQLASAAELYTGPFLDGFHIPEVAEFERWVDVTRARFAEMYSQALKSLAKTASTHTDNEGGVRWWRKLCAHDPTSDEIALSLMRALASAGDVAGALRHAQIHTDLLRQDLELEPGPEITQFVEELRKSRSEEAAPLPPVTVRLKTPPAMHVTEESRASKYLRSPNDAVSKVPRLAPRPPSAAERGAPPVLFRRAFAAPSLTRSGKTEPVAPATNRVVEGSALAPTSLHRPPAYHRTGFGRARLMLGWALLGAIPVGALVVRASNWMGGRSDNEATPNEASVVVLPFSVRGDSTDSTLGSSTPRLLAARLDGSLGLQVVPADPSPATGGGASLGTPAPGGPTLAAPGQSAGLKVSGEVVASGDRLRISAVMRNRQGEVRVTESAVVEGTRKELPALLDRLAAELLASRFEGSHGEIIRLAASSTKSLAAAKAYLEAESDLLKGDFVAAIDAYREALRIDKSFALAHYGLSGAAGMVGEDGLARRSAEEALRHASGLPIRERRMLVAFLARQRGNVVEAERRYADLTTDYPLNGEAWSGLAETRFHFTPLVGVPATEARAAFERVTSLDPSNVSAYLHVARILSLQGDVSGARRLVGRARSLASDETLRGYALHVLSLGGPDQGSDPQQLALASERLDGSAAVEMLISGKADDPRWRATAMLELRSVATRLGSLVAAGQRRMQAVIASLAAEQ
jgi:DNA-binding SARP family transcriptional activator/tetratricopeptide (TPR) repeat protein